MLFIQHSHRALFGKARHIENERLNECHLPRRATTSPVVAWLAIVAIAGVAWYFFLVQVIFGTPVGTNPAPDAVVVVVWLVFGIGLPLFGYAIKLVTTVRMDGVVVRFFPLATRRISLREVAAYQVRRYRAIAEYGGYPVWATQKAGVDYGWRRGR